MGLFRRKTKHRDGFSRFGFASLAVATLCMSALGYIGLFAPLDEIVSVVRDLVRARPADGRIAVVGIDTRTMQRLPQWGQRRSIDAEVVDSLFANGARRVFYDKVFAEASSKDDDHAFASALRRHRGQVFLAARFEVGDHNTRNWLEPTSELRASADIASINVWRDALGFTSRIPFSSQIDGHVYPTFSAMLSDVPIKKDSSEQFRPDFSIKHETIPTLSLSDVFDKPQLLARTVRGKDVLIGVISDSFGDTHVAPAQGPIPGVYLHAIGAQTLREGVPVFLGRFPAILFVTAIVAATLALHGRLRATLLSSAMALLLIGPLGLDALHIRVDIIPALILLGYCAVRLKRDAALAKTASSGLPSPATLAAHGTLPRDWIVALKLGRYADLIATLPKHDATVVVEQLRDGLQRSAMCRELTHEGDAFVWRVRQVDIDEEAIVGHCEALTMILSRTVAMGDRRIDLQLGIGIDGATDMPAGKRVGSAMRSAAQALSTGKRAIVSTREANAHADLELSMIDEVEAAIANGEIWAAFQPKWDLHGKFVASAEVLARWSHPDRGNIPPDKFIPVLEQVDRLDLLTDFMMDQACAMAARMADLGEPISCAVNVSPRTLADTSFARRVRAGLDKYGLGPDALVIEITESAALEGADSFRTLAALHTMNIKISVDDFGTGYASLEQLRALQAAELKVDRSLVLDMDKHPHARAILQTAIDLGHSMQMAVVAEGVETREELKALKEMGCDLIQGYLISRPLPGEGFVTFVTNMRQNKGLEIDSWSQHAA